MGYRNALITGGCGFVGRHMLSRLLDDNFETIWIIDDLSIGIHPEKWRALNIRDLERVSPWLVSFSIGESRTRIMMLHADLIQVALAELGKIPRNNLPSLPQFDEIYHLASVVGGRNVIDNDPLSVGIDLAIDSAFYLWVAKIARPSRVLYASSSAAYPISLQATGKSIALKEEMIDFSDELGKPDYTYGWSKLTGEYLGRIAVEKYGLNVAIVRPFSGYGEDQEPVYPFPAIALRVAARQNPVIVWGTGLQGRDFVHIDDACEACVRACRTISDASAVNIGWGTVVTMKALAERMIEIEGYEAIVVGKEGRPTGVATRFSDTSRMQQILGWKPTIALDEGIRRALKVAKSRLAEGIEPED